MHTQVALDAIRPVIYGYHENPFEILGPHEIVDNGRRALAVRAYLPEAQRAWLVEPGHGNARPMRRIHPAGLYEAVCPVDSAAANCTNSATCGTGAALPAPCGYQLRVTYKSGETHTMHDP